ncbi:fasciclin domain-containing protein [Pontixanthobacter gangjinensis]|uniref:Fasciclin domain-containing protein n=1 Tax=Christiangramia aestuarii TaxID=1028746 RepID=A0A7K1LQP7_9FLAO|nr:fasciclin domain-containing protein [Christiangramia aestuarii]MUP43088.1 fasciclin domain-containing protein [Christiangramia aestuarii]
MRTTVTIKNSILKSLLLAIVFVFASCETESPSEAELLSLDAHTSPAAQKSDQSIVEIAKADGRFTTLLALLEQTGLKPIFESGTDQYTVFAPTDDAFAAFLAANPNLDLTDNALLTAVLTYHVTEGRRFSNSVLGKKNPKTIETLNGGYIYVDNDGGIDTNDEDMLANSNILVGEELFDIAASNGVIHAIDAVLVPTE